MYLYRMNLEDRNKERGRICAKILERDQVFIERVIRERFSLTPNLDCKILDFGCGRGDMVKYLSSRGYNAFGCDIHAAWEGFPDSPVERLALISSSPYRLPYEANTFDLVYSTSVLEHAKNQEEVFQEIHRILKPGGISMHYYPGKWYLPYEPHIRIPLLNYFWPSYSKLWINFWLMLRVLYIPNYAPYRKQVLERYCEFCEKDIIYVPNSRYRQLSIDTFGNFGSLTKFYIEIAEGGFAKLARKLPFRRLSAWFMGNFRMNFIFQQK